MKKHVALTLLLVTTLGVLDAHVDLAEIDGRRFVQAQGRLHDSLGWLEDRWTALVRNCAAVRVLDERAPEHARALAAISAFSPPDSGSARLLQLQGMDDWLLAEVEFDRLNPAAVPLRSGAEGVQVVGTAIWSSSTEPWRPAPRIRRHLQARAPDMPPMLRACHLPRAALFQGP